MKNIFESYYINDNPILLWIFVGVILFIMILTCYLVIKEIKNVY